MCRKPKWLAQNQLMNADLPQWPLFPRAWPGPFLTPFGLAGYGFLDFGSKRRGKTGGISKLVPFGFSWRLRGQLLNSPFDCDFMAFDLDSWLNRDMLIIFPCFSELVWFSSLERKPCNISPFESSGCKCSCNIIVYISLGEKAEVLSPHRICCPFRWAVAQTCFHHMHFQKFSNCSSF